MKLIRPVYAILLCFLANTPMSAQEQTGLRVEVRPLVTLTGDEAGTPFGRIAAAAFSGNDDLLVADALNFHVLRFSPSGEFVKAQGRQGTGPGEYQMIEWMGYCGDQVVVFDLMLRRFIVLTKELSYSSAFQFTGTPSALSCSSQGTMAYLLPHMEPPAPDAGAWRARAALTVMDKLGAEPRSLAEVPLADIVAVGGSPMMAPGGRSTTLAVLPSGSVVVGTGDVEPAALYSSPGSTPSTIALGLPAQRLTDAMRRVSAEDFVSRVSDAEMREVVLTQLMRRRYEGPAPSYRRLMADPTGLLWIQLSLPGTDSLQLVAMDTSGRTAARVSFPFAGLLAAVGMNRLAIVSEDADGAPVVYIVRVVR